MKDWFFHQERGKTLGPITIDELKTRIRDGRIRLTDLIFKDGEPGWRMALEYPDLRPEFKTTAAQELKDRPWVVLQRKNEASFEFVTAGPYGEENLKKAIAAGKVSYSDYVWRDGFKEWRRIGSLTEFNRRASAAQTPPSIPPIPEASREDALKNVVEFRRPRLPEPEPPPPEAMDPEDMPTVVSPPPVERRESESRAVEKAPEEVAPPPPFNPVLNDTPSLADLPPVETGTNITPIDTSTSTGSATKPKSLWVDWGIVAGLAMMLIAAIFLVSKYIRTPPVPPEELVESQTTEATAPSPEPVEPRPPAVAQDAGIPVTEDPPSASQSVAKKPPPTQLFVAAQTVSSNQVRIEVRTDATPEYPVYIQIVGLPGQVSDGAAFYRYLKFIPQGDGAKPLDLSGLKLPQGKFFFRVATGDLRKEAKVSVGVTEPAYKNAIVRLRKQHAAALWGERLQLFRLSQDLEYNITQAVGGKRFSSKGLSPLLGVKRSNGSKYILYDQWYELKEILQAAQNGPSQALLERARKARERLAAFSVWK